MLLLGNYGKYGLSVIIERDKYGYAAFCPELQGCYTQGDTYEEVIQNIKDAIKLHIEDRVANNEEIPQVELLIKTGEIFMMKKRGDEAKEDEIKEIKEYEMKKKEGKLELHEI